MWLKIFWIAAWSLSELSAFVNGATHRCAAMPLTKPATSDFGLSSNPIRRHAPPLLMLPSAPDMACGSRYSYAGVHGCKWHKRIPPRPGTAPPPSEIHRGWCIHSSGY